MSFCTTSNLFQKSYENHKAYPTNLIYRTEYRTTLEHYRNKLQRAEERLCSDKGGLDVGFRDFDSRCKELRL
jgi:hypothetical protein